MPGTVLQPQRSVKGKEIDIGAPLGLEDAL
jgi:hypothetical protein